MRGVIEEFAKALEEMARGQGKSAGRKKSRGRGQSMGGPPIGGFGFGSPAFRIPSLGRNGRAGSRAWGPERRAPAREKWGGRVIVKSNYTQSKGAAWAHLGYIGRRAEGGMFDRDQDDVDRKAWWNEHKNNVENGHIVGHRVVISPDLDHDQNLKEYTRETMSEYEEHTGKKLEWIAAEHTDTDHRHVHVFILGRCENEDGEPRTFTMKRGELWSLKEIAEDERERHHEHGRAIEKEIEREEREIELERVQDHEPEHVVEMDHER